MGKINDYQIEGLLEKVKPKEVVLQTLLNNHDESLKVATNIYKRNE